MVTPERFSSHSPCGPRKYQTCFQLICVFLAALAATCGANAATGPDRARYPLEDMVTCHPGLSEHFLLRIWAWTAAGHNGKKLTKYIETLRTQGWVEPLTIPASDGRILVGWRLGNSAAASKVAVTVGLGNISSADIMVQRLEAVARKTGYDFFILDYRGYVRSKPGAPSLRAFIQDQVDIGAMLRSKGYETVMGYGASLGGIVLANSVHNGLKLDRLIVDSIPSDLQSYKCSPEVFPINTIGTACPNVVAITSEHDGEVSKEDQAQLLSRIEGAACGGQVIHLHTAIHAFNDKQDTLGDLERLEALEQALTMEKQRR